MDFFQVLKRYLFSSRSDSLVRRLALISCLSLTVGVGALIVISTVMGGMNSSIADRVLALNPHYELFGEHRGTEGDLRTHDVYGQLLQLTKNQVTGVYVGTRQDLILRNERGAFRGAVGYGWDQAGWKEMSQRTEKIITEKKNDFLTWSNADLPPAGSIDIGLDLARSFGILEGDIIAVFSPETMLLPTGEIPQFVNVTVRQIINTSLQDLDGFAVFFDKDLTLSQLKENPSHRFVLQVWLKDPYTNLLSLLNTVPKLQILSWKQRYKSLFFALKLELTLITMFLIVGSLVASFSVATVLILLLSQKRSDISLFRTIGMSRKQAQNLFWKLGIGLGMFGVSAGALCGAMISIYLEQFPIPTFSQAYYDSFLPARFNFLFVLSVLGAALFIVGLTAYLSVKNISSWSITDGLQSQLKR